MREDYQAALGDPVIGDPRREGAERLAALEAWAEVQRKGGGLGALSPEGAGINNHIHTIYSFSPYSPCMAALRAREAGLAAAGSVDHDSAAASEEMIAACAILGIGGCSGFEVRVSFKGSGPGGPGPFARRKINNPDSEGIAYMTVQGIPRRGLPRAAEFLRPIREERLKRTRAMSLRAGELLREGGLGEIDFDREVRGASLFDRGGGITERHLLQAAGNRFIQKYGKGPALLEGLREKLGIGASPRIRDCLSDPGNPHYLYDLLGLLKAEFLPRVFLQPGDAECPPAEEVCAFAASIGGIPAYAYLGDVAESPTGDKRAEKFEDGYLEELFPELARLGFRALAYMPPRNTPEQLRRLRGFASEYGFLEISGVDINSSRQSFACPEVLREEFRHLVDSTWALAAHERLSSEEPRLGFFSPENPLRSLSLGERLLRYAAAGKGLDPRRPGDFKRPPEALLGIRD